MGQNHEALRSERANPALKHKAVIERAPNQYAAYVTGLPDYVATGSARAGKLEQVREAVEFHIGDMLEDGEPVPEPQTTAAVVEAAGVTE